MSSVSVYYFSEFLASSAFNSFISLFYRARGMSMGRLSLLMAAAPLTAFLALPLWGTLCDRAGKRNTVHITVIFGASLSVLLFDPADTFGKLLWVSCLFAFFSTVITPLGETVALSYLHHRRLPFGPCRLYGALAYALGGLVLGILLEGREARFVPICSIAYALCAVAAMSLPTIHRQTPARPAKKTLTYDGLKHARTTVAPHAPKLIDLRRTSYGFLLEHQFLPLLLFSLCIQVTQGIFYTFYAPYLTDVLGASRRTVGYAVALGALCEIPFLRFGDKILHRLGTPFLLLLSAITMALHWLLLGLFPHRFVGIALQIFSISGTTAAAFAMAKHVSRYTPAAHKARAQTLLYLITYACARTIGSLFGGFLHFLTNSLPAVFVISGIALLVCCAVFAKAILLHSSLRR